MTTRNRAPKRRRATFPASVESPKQDRPRVRLIPFEVINSVWPSPFPDAAYLARRSRLGKFPAYVKLHSMKSPPLWRADEVAAYLRDSFGKVAPELVQHAVEQLLGED